MRLACRQRGLVPRTEGSPHVNGWIRQSGSGSRLSSGFSPRPSWCQGTRRPDACGFSHSSADIAHRIGPASFRAGLSIPGIGASDVAMIPSRPSLYHTNSSGRTSLHNRSKYTSRPPPGIPTLQVGISESSGSPMRPVLSGLLPHKHNGVHATGSTPETRGPWRPERLVFAWHLSDLLMALRRRIMVPRFGRDRFFRPEATRSWRGGGTGLAPQGIDQI